MKDVIFYLSELLHSGKITSRELTEKYIEEIKKLNPTLNAFVRYTFDEALKQADYADELLRSGKGGLLTGIPMTLKDNICTDGMETTCCSKILKGYVPFYDATAWKKLKEQGAVLLGKTNMDEFAMGSTCETSCYGTALNPRDLTKVPGGSSGGVASAVSANLAPYGLGSDTGGSIRQPAGFCGIVGLKPTYGAVSRYGLIAYGSSLDQIGPLCLSVKDCAVVFDAIKGKDVHDSTSIDSGNDTIYDKLGKDVKGLKIGYVKEFFEGLDEEIASSVKKAIDFYKENGAEIVEISLPTLQIALPVYYIIACAEASSNLGRYDGIRYGLKAEHYQDVNDMIKETRTQGFGKEVKRRIMLGTYVLSSGYYDAYYKKARELRVKIKKDFENAFAKCDCIIAPTVPNTAFPLNYTSKNVIEMYLSDIYTVPVNVAGLPSVSLPCGKDKSGMPISMQIIGNALQEEKILNTAYYYEQNYDCGIEEADMGVKL